MQALPSNPLQRCGNAKELASKPDTWVLEQDLGARALERPHTAAEMGTLGSMRKPQ